jgi:hypothetical protein
MIYKVNFLDNHYKVTLLDSSLELFASIATPSFAEIMILSLLMDADKLTICFSKRISRYADTATGKLLFTIRLINSLTIIYEITWKIKDSYELDKQFLLHGR